MKHNYEVVVGNIGTVYSGHSKAKATLEYNGYVRDSKFGPGRASGESVTLFIDGEIGRDYQPVEKPLKFRDLSVGAIFEFKASEDHPEWLDIARGPWMKRSERQYYKALDIPGYKQIWYVVGTINTEVVLKCGHKGCDNCHPSNYQACTGLNK